MIYSIFPTKDTTIFEHSASMNTGIDEILEMTKIISASHPTLGDKVYNSRILMQFDIQSISQSIQDNIIGTEDLKFYLNMYISEANDLPHSYGLEARPLSQSWEMGIGRANHYPETTEGASWTYRAGEDAGLPWTTGSWAANSSGSWTTGSYYDTIGDTPGAGGSGEAVTVAGGGTWHTTASGEYYASQSFTYESGDVRMDVTNIVQKWLSGSIENDGILIKRSGSEERDSKKRGSLKFFSRDTHTIYSPKLEVCWNEASGSFNTGSLDPLDVLDKDSIIYMRHNNGKYKENTRTRFRVYGREKYPAKTFATTSAELTIKYLPSSSYYCIKDGHTDETIVPFDTKYTTLSCDSNGNYFDLYMNGLQPERHYRFVYKVVSGSRMEFYDNNYLFKVVR